MIRNRSTLTGVFIPELAHRDVLEAAAWRRGPGFKERQRIGNHRAQSVHGGASVVVIAPPSVYNLAHAVRVHAPNPDSHRAHAQACAADILDPPTSQP